MNNELELDRNKSWLGRLRQLARSFSFLLLFFFFQDKGKRLQTEQLSEANLTPGYSGIHPDCVNLTVTYTMTHTHTNLNDKRAGHTLSR